jgi:hypothetical protein
MHRLACFLLVVTACSDSGTGTGAATLSNVTPTVMSAAASSFSGPDANGTKVLGWTINFYKGAPGADCKSKGTNVSASIGIFTNQTGSGKAMLSLGDIGIVTTSPPDTTAGAAANMGAVGINGIQGVTTITEFAADIIKGTVNAGGTATAGGGVTMSGMFEASICE